MNGPFVDYPFTIDGTGRLARTEIDDHVRDMIDQVLFTSPGERVNRPDFGCGLLELVFEPNSELLAAATELRVRGALQRWLSDVIDVEALSVHADGERLVVDLVYVRLVDGARTELRLPVPGGTR